MVPAWTEVTLFVIETEILFPLLPLPAPAPQPPNSSITPHRRNHIRGLGAGSKRWIVSITLLQFRE